MIKSRATSNTLCVAARIVSGLLCTGLVRLNQRRPKDLEYLLGMYGMVRTGITQWRIGADAPQLQRPGEDYKFGEINSNQFRPERDADSYSGSGPMNNQPLETSGV